MEFEWDEAKASSNLNSAQNVNDDLADEYRLDYRNAKPNRFAVRGEAQGLTVVVLDEDVAEVFKTPEFGQ